MDDILVAETELSMGLYLPAWQIGAGGQN